MKKHLARFVVGSIAVAAALLLAACGNAVPTDNPSPQGGGDSTDNVGELIPVVIGVSTTIFPLPVQTALSEGIFEEHGIDAELMTLQSAADSAALLASGDIQFSMFDVHNAILAVSEGADIILTAPLTTTRQTASDDPHGFGSLAVAADGDIQRPEDLVGKKIGISSLGSASYLDFRQKLEQLGVDPDSIQWLAVPGSQHISSIRQGQIDGAAIGEPHLSAGIVAGDLRPILAVDDVMEGAPNYGIASSATWAAANADIVGKVRSAILEAAALLNSDRALAVKAVSENMDVSDEALEIMVFPPFAAGYFDEAGYKQVADRLVRNGLIAEDRVPEFGRVVYDAN